MYFVFSLFSKQAFVHHYYFAMGMLRYFVMGMLRLAIAAWAEAASRAGVAQYHPRMTAATESTGGPGPAIIGSAR